MGLRQRAQPSPQRLGHRLDRRCAAGRHGHHPQRDREQVLHPVIHLAQQKPALALGLLEVVDVGAGAEPARDPAVLAAHAMGPPDDPAIAPRTVPQPVFDAVRLAGFHAAHPGLAGAFLVVGVEHVLPARPVGRSGRRAREVIPAVVEVVVVAVRQGGPDHLVDRVHDGLELRLAFAQGGLGPQGIGHVRRLHEDPLPHIAGFSERLVDEVHDAVLRRIARQPPEGDGDRAADIRLAGGEDAVEQGQEALRPQFGQGIRDPHALDVRPADQFLEGGIDDLDHVGRAAQDAGHAGGLREQAPEPLDLRFGPAVRHDRPGRLVALVEDADDGAVLVADRREAVVPVGFLLNPAPHDRQHEVEGRKALARLHHMGKLRPHDIPDVEPDLGRGPAEGGRVALARDRGPGVVVEKPKIGPPVDRGRKARVQADRERQPQRLRPAVDGAERGAFPVVPPDAFAKVAAARMEAGIPDAAVHLYPICIVWRVSCARPAAGDGGAGTCRRSVEPCAEAGPNAP